MEDHLTTKQVADALQVSESSVKRWCNRGAIPTVRTLGGHRRIPMSGLMEFLDASELQLAKPIEPLGASCESKISTMPDASRTLSMIRDEFESALMEGEEITCRKLLVESYAKAKSFAKLADLFVASAFHRIGELWQCGDLEVYQERRCCEICTRLLNDFRSVIPQAPSNAPLAIGGSVEGDQYSIPSHLIDLVLRECSWRAINLGPNLPLSSLAAAVSTLRPKLLWLSISHLERPEQFVADYRTFRDSLPPELMVVLGGRALNDQLRPQLEYTGFCDNMQQFAAFATALHGRKPDLNSTGN